MSERAVSVLRVALLPAWAAVFVVFALALALRCAADWLLGVIDAKA